MSRVIGSASNEGGRDGSALGGIGPVPVLIAISMDVTLFDGGAFVAHRVFAEWVISDSLFGSGGTGVLSEVR